MNVYLPKDRVTNNHQGYGFVEFRSEEDADYVSPEWSPLFWFTVPRDHVVSAPFCWQRSFGIASCLLGSCSGAR